MCFNTEELNSLNPPESHREARQPHGRSTREANTEKPAEDKPEV
jgi:hypothetical protein